METNLKQVELRATDVGKFSTDDSTGLNVGGYVNQTGTKSDLLQDFDGTDFYEVIQPGVFSEALKSGNFVDFYYEHDPSKCLASTSDNSMQLSEDNIGLKMNATIVPTTWGQDAYEMIKCNRTAGMSFGFIVTGENWDTSGDTPIRTITALQLFEVSAVRFPAYPASDIQARSKKVNSLNKTLEKRGMRLNSIQIPNEKEDRSMADSGVTSNDMNNLISAINSLQKSVDSQTDCISSSFTSLLNGLGNEETNSKNPKSKEKRDDDPNDKDKSDDEKKKSDEKSKEEERKKQAAKEKEAKEKRSATLKKLETLNNMIK